MMFEVKAVIRQDCFEDVMRALHGVVNMPGVTVSNVSTGPAPDSAGTQLPAVFDEPTFASLETVVPLELLDAVVQAIEEFAKTGRRGAGTIVVVPVRRAN